MEISEKKFYQTLLGYFEKRYQECNALDAEAVETIIRGLEELLTKTKLGGRENIKVHIGKLFGFKIK